GLGFLQKPDDLLFRKALLHVRLLLRKRTLLDSGWPCLQGAGQFDLHKRLDLFLDNPTNPYHLDSLVSGLIGYELRARLTNTNTNTH
ncbi:hypothetical protein QZM01_21835, partial [Burkholderia multivorans]|nr:hypothetical protein [Burkholderia multivorans]